MSSKSATHSSAQQTRTALTFTLVFTGIFLALGACSRARTNAHLAWTFGGVAAFLLGWQMLVLLRAKQKRTGLGWEFVPVKAHWVQALMHTSIFIYWGWYWRNVYAEVPLILSQVVFLYILDALLTWSRGRKWRLGFGPFPIVLSTNLFMWFHDDWFLFQFLMVATGALGKQFIHWKRDGKDTHVFNPSAFGLTLFSIVLILTNNSDNTWGRQIAVTQGLPPHIYLEMFLCGMVVQYFFRVTLLTFSAAAILGIIVLAYTKITGVYFFSDTNIPIAVFLGLHLLMTDPATTPHNSLGKIIFGTLYGISVILLVLLLDAFGAPGFYDKLLVVPLLNLMVPLLDRITSIGLAKRYARWEDSVGAHRMNLGYMACWIGVFIVMLTTGFVDAPHPGATIWFWKTAAEQKKPHAVENLQYLLNDFAKRDLDDTNTPLATLGLHEQGDRSQSLGILCNQVGVIYGEGKVVPQDPDRSAYYFTRASDFGDLEGSANLVIQDLSTNRVADTAAFNRALTALEKTSLSGTNARNCYLVGFACDTGHNVPVDKMKAREFYQRGAQLGDVLSTKSLARMQLKGEGGPADNAAAAVNLQKMADLADGPSCFYLARLYRNGDGVPQDEKRAITLFQKACDLGVQQACQILQTR